MSRSGQVCEKAFLQAQTCPVLHLEIRGIAPGAYTEVFIHNLVCKIGRIEFKAPFAIADSDDVPPILGRVKGLDLFEAIFYKGKETVLTK